jgi:hypothetical protein
VLLSRQLAMHTCAAKTCSLSMLLKNAGFIRFFQLDSVIENDSGTLARTRPLNTVYDDTVGKKLELELLLKSPLCRSQQMISEPTIIDTGSIRVLQSSFVLQISLYTVFSPSDSYVH